MGKVGFKTTVDGLGTTVKERVSVLGGFNLPRQPNAKMDDSVA
jgi:hypothetical protein